MFAFSVHNFDLKFFMGHYILHKMRSYSLCHPKSNYYISKWSNV